MTPPHPAPPRISLYPTGPTPLEPANRLGAALGFHPGHLRVKRDDLTALAFGGNKVRKLEFLVADAIYQGADVLVAGGGAQSNAVRATAAAAAVAGLRCVAVLGGPAPAVVGGNLLLDRLLGCEIEWLQNYDFDLVEARILALCAELSSNGAKPYRVPIGASTALGARGYARCAAEIHAAWPECDTVVVAAGSGGTHAGLLVGFAQLAATGVAVPTVMGVDVGARPAVDRAIDAIAGELAAQLSAGARSPFTAPKAWVLGGEIGMGYGAPTASALAALRLAAQTEGLILDPVYTAKALAGLIAARKRGDLKPDARVIFLHTGGAPGLFDPRWVHELFDDPQPP